MKNSYKKNKLKNVINVKQSENIKKIWEPTIFFCFNLKKKRKKVYPFYLQKLRLEKTALKILPSLRTNSFAI